MTFLGIGPGELFLILIILLVVVGPERLPGFARQAGKMIVSLRNWVQRSPDAMMLLRARDELEQELREIRDDLTQEMQTVRDEMNSVRNEVLQATREATIDVSRQLDAATHEIDLAARDAIETIQETAENTIGAEQAIEPDALGDALPPVTTPPSTPPLELDVPIADTVADAGVQPAIEEVDQVVRTIAPPEMDFTPNGVPYTVPRTLKPNAPVIPVDAEIPLAIREADSPAQLPPAEELPQPETLAASAAPQNPDDPTRVEIDSLKQQLQNVTTELRALSELIHQIQAGLHPAAPEIAADRHTRQPDEVHDAH